VGRNRLPWLLAGLGGLAAAAVLVAALPFGRADERPQPQGAVQHFTYTEPPLPVPETPFADAAGTTVTLAAFRGRVVLLNFWATWCAPCIREMPALDRLQGSLGGRDFTVLIVSEDRGGAKVAVPFLKKLGVERLDTYLDAKGKLARALGLKGLPTTILIDRAGREVGRLRGPADWDAPEAEALLRHFIAPAEPELIETRT
jgi:thiol-disulfide isomerase/thioredoxin